MLEILPAETVLHVLSFAPLPTLVNLEAVSKDWKAFYEQHFAHIYRGAAHLHGLISSPTATLDDALVDLPGDIWKDEAVEDWKELCRRHIQLEKNWQGRAKSRSIARIIRAAGNKIHRIQVDEEQGICITTSSAGGLTVSDIGSTAKPSAVLWQLPAQYVRSHAHVEYDSGYLIFDRFDGKKEIWRLKTTLSSDAPSRSATLPPDDFMYRVAAFVRDTKRMRGRGEFVPWALVDVGETALAYHYVHPTLAVVGSSRVFLVDVPSGTKSKLKTVRQSVTYVELNARYVIVCSPTCVRVYARDGDGAGSGVPVLEIPAATVGARVANVQLSHTPKDEMDESKILARTSLHDWDRESLNDVDSWGKWAAADRQRVIAAHLTPDGRHLAVLNQRERVMLVQDWERVLRGEATLEECTLVVRSNNSTNFYLASAPGRFAVASSTGLWIYTLDGTDRLQSDPPRTFGVDVAASVPFRNMAVSAVHPWRNEDDDGWEDENDEEDWSRPTVSCLQLTDRRIFFAWSSATHGVPLYSGPPWSSKTSSASSKANPYPMVSVSRMQVVEDDGQDEDDEDEDEVVEARQLVPWSSPVELGCIDLSLLPKPKYLRIPANIRAMLGEGWRR